MSLTMWLMCQCVELYTHKVQKFWTSEQNQNKSAEGSRVCTVSLEREAHTMWNCPMWHLREVENKTWPFLRARLREYRHMMRGCTNSSVNLAAGMEDRGRCAVIVSLCLRASGTRTALHNLENDWRLTPLTTLLSRSCVAWRVGSWGRLTASLSSLFVAVIALFVVLSCSLPMSLLDVPPRGFRQRDNVCGVERRKSILDCYVLHWHVLWFRRSRSSGHRVLLVRPVYARFVFELLFGDLCDRSDPWSIFPQKVTVFPACFGAANCPTLRHSLLMSWWLPVLLSCATLIVDIPLNMSSSGLELRQSYITSVHFPPLTSPCYTVLERKHWYPGHLSTIKILSGLNFIIGIRDNSSLAIFPLTSAGGVSGAYNAPSSSISLAPITRQFHEYFIRST